MAAAHPFGEERREQRLADGLGDHRLLPGIVRDGLAPARAQAIQHLVAGLLRGLRVAVRAQAGRCLRQHGEQGGLAVREGQRGFAQISAAGRFDAFQHAAHRRARQVKLEDFLF